MKQAPLISVIMPAYNAEVYIGRAIDSILAQTFRDFELIIVDDGSSDKTQKIIRSYEDKRVKLLAQSNKGASSARNNAIRKARGIFIAMHDADDISVPERFESQIDFLRQNSDVGLVGSNIQVIDAEGTHRSIVSLLTHPDDLKLGEIFSNQIAQGSVMLRRSVLEKSGLYNPKVAFAEDTDLWRRASHYCRIANLKEPLYKYREHSEGVSQNIDKIHKSALKTGQREFKYFQHHVDEYKFFSFHPLSMHGGIKTYLQRKSNVYRCMSMMYYPISKWKAIAVGLLAWLHAPWIAKNYIQLAAILVSSKKMEMGIDTYEFF